MDIVLRIGSSIVPVFLVIGLGAFLSRRLEFHLPTLNLLTLYVFTPCLVFDAIVRQEAGGSSLLVLLCAIVVSALFLGLGRGVAWLAGADRPATASIQGTCGFLNAGNMGLPIVLFAYGEAGLARGAAFMVGMAVTIHTVGILVYSMGREDGLGKSLAQVFRVPLIYAAALGILLPLGGIELPAVVARPVWMLGQAAIPMLLLSFGIQLGRVGFRLPRAVTWAAVAVRLLLGPVVGFALAYALLRAGLFGSLDVKVVAVMAGLPPAVYNYLFAERFGGDVELVSEVILWTTLASFVTVSLVLGLVG